MALVTAGGFADDTHGRFSERQFKQPAMTQSGVREIVKTTVQVKLQVQLGKIQAGVDGSDCVLGHPCKCWQAVIGEATVATTSRNGSNNRAPDPQSFMILAESLRRAESVSASEDSSPNISAHKLTSAAGFRRREAD